MRTTVSDGTTRPGRGSGVAAAAIIVLALTVPGCMENEIVAPEMLEDARESAIYFPDQRDWERRTPAEAGFDADRLEEAVAFARAHETEVPTDLRAYLEGRFEGMPDQEILGPIKNRGSMSGIIVKDGYIVAEWGDTQRVDMAFSVTKSFLATVVGLALDEGLIDDVHAPVARAVSDGGYDSPHNAPITWHMSLQQTSEWEGTLWDKPDTADRREGRDRQLQEPGTFWEYNDVRVNRVALSALRVWEESLPEVLQRKVMGPIGASRSWRWHGYENSTVEIDGAEVESVSGGGHWGGGLWINSQDLARFGYLYLREGRWREERILSRDWVAAATTPSELNPTYGYMWWVNGEQQLWPDVPAEAFAARGGGDNLLFVDPVHALVVVVRWIDRGHENELFSRIIAALEDGA